MSVRKTKYNWYQKKQQHDKERSIYVSSEREDKKKEEKKKYEKRSKTSNVLDAEIWAILTVGQRKSPKQIISEASCCRDGGARDEHCKRRPRMAVFDEEAKSQANICIAIVDSGYTSSDSADDEICVQASICAGKEESDSENSIDELVVQEVCLMNKDRKLDEEMDLEQTKFEIILLQESDCLPRPTITMWTSRTSG